MQLKNLWEHMSLPAKMKLFWERVTSSRLITFYFVFSVVHATVQVALQAQAFSVNKTAAEFLWSIVLQGNATANGFMVFDNDLRLCQSVTASLSTAPCQVIWDGTPVNNTQYGTSNNNEVFTSTMSFAFSAGSSTSGLQSMKSSSAYSSSSSTVSSSAVYSSVSAPYDSVSRGTNAGTLFPSTLSSSLSAPPKSQPSAHMPIRVGNSQDYDVHPRNTLTSTHLQYLQSRQEPVIQAVQVSGQTEVFIQGIGLPNQDVILGQDCLLALNWPVSQLNNTIREDILFILFQIWVLGMSLVALLNESIPHVIASLLTHAIATGWSGVQLGQTAGFHSSFTRLTTNGVCRPVDLLPRYWKPRNDAEIASFALNVAFLILSVILSWRLIKAFGWRTFKRIGASLTIHRQYTAVLVLSILIQLSLFFIIAAIGLWIDQLYNGVIARMATAGLLYKAMVGLVLSLLIPWLTLGWVCARRELRVPMLIFLSLSLLYLAGWGGMFASPTFRWTFVQWYFFGTMACASVFLTASTFIVGCVCYLGFGKGLHQYLNVEKPLLRDDFTASPSDIEKVEFLHQKSPTPTFSAEFGGADGLVPSNPFEPQPLYTAHLHSDSFSSSSSHPRSISRAGSDRSAASHSSSELSYLSLNQGPYVVPDHSGTRFTRSNRWIID